MYIITNDHWIINENDHFEIGEFTLKIKKIFLLGLETGSNYYD